MITICTEYLSVKSHKRSTKKSLYGGNALIFHPQVFLPLFFFFLLYSNNLAFSFSLNNPSCCWDNSLLRTVFLLRGNVDCTYKHPLPRVYNSNSNITWTIVSATCSKHIQTKVGLLAFSEMLWKCHHNFICHSHKVISLKTSCLSPFFESGTPCFFQLQSAWQYLDRAVNTEAGKLWPLYYLEILSGCKLWWWREFPITTEKTRFYHVCYSDQNIHFNSRDGCNKS